MPRLTRPLFAALAAMVLGHGQPAPAAEPDAEARLKAGFVFNFTKYVDWPAETAPSGSGALNLCLPPEADIGQSGVGLLHGQAAQGASIAVLNKGRVLEAGHCHVLWIPRSHDRMLPELLRLAARSRALTVSDIPGFLDAGGMIELVKVDDRLRFDVSTAAARRAGLRLSSHLLKLARNVREPEGAL